MTECALAELQSDHTLDEHILEHWRFDSEPRQVVKEGCHRLLAKVQMLTIDLAFQHGQSFWLFLADKADQNTSLQKSSTLNYTHV